MTPEQLTIVESETNATLEHSKQNQWPVLFALKHCGWDNEERKFDFEQLDFAEAEKTVRMLEWSTNSEVLLVLAVKATVAARQPLPLPCMESLGSIAGLQFDELTCLCLDSEDEIKSLEKRVEATVVAMKTMVAKSEAVGE